MPVTITITGATAEEADAELRTLADLMLSPTVLEPTAVDTTAMTNVVEMVADHVATAQDEEPKKRGRPKRDTSHLDEYKIKPKAKDEQPTMTAAQAEEYMNGSKLPPGPVTLEQCLEAMRIVAAKHNYDEVRRLMTAIGYPKVSLIPEEKRAEFVAMAQSWEPAKAAE